MKNENRLSSKRRLGFALTMVLLTLPGGCHKVPKAQTIKSETLVFEGTLEKIGSDPGIVSGILAVYRLAKYRIDKVCQGEYEGTEIVVDHAIFTLKEFEGIKVKDRVCVQVKRSPKMGERYNADGIRSPSDDVKTFYIAEEGPKLTEGKCCGSQK